MHNSNLHKDETVSLWHRHPYVFLVLVLVFLLFIFGTFSLFSLALNWHRLDALQLCKTLLLLTNSCVSKHFSPRTLRCINTRRFHHFSSSRPFGSSYLLCMCVSRGFMWQTSLRWISFVCLYLSVVAGESMCRGPISVALFLGKEEVPGLWCCSGTGNYSILTRCFSFSFYNLLLSCVWYVPQMFAAWVAAPGLPVAPRPRVPVVRDDIIWPPCCHNQGCCLRWVCFSGSWWAVWRLLTLCSLFTFSPGAMLVK